LSKFTLLFVKSAIEISDATHEGFRHVQAAKQSSVNNNSTILKLPKRSRVFAYFSLFAKLITQSTDSGFIAAGCSCNLRHRGTELAMSNGCLKKESVSLLFKQINGIGRFL